MLNLITWWKVCRKQGHDWKFDSHTLGGDWIRCSRCHALDEYLPGTHEPEGYDYNAVHPGGREGR